MTRYSDNLEVGFDAITSALASRASVQLTRSHRFTGGGNQTWTGVFPSNVQALDAVLYINSNGSATTSDIFTITASAGGTALGSITSVGSATGLLRVTTTGLGVISMIASACQNIGPTGLTQTEVPFRVILSSVDTATDYRLELMFRKALGASL